MKCFYHSADLDGHCSGAIVKYRYPECEMYPINYGDEFPWDEIKPDEIIFMVDFCLQPHDKMKLLGDTLLHYIDHHADAVTAMRNMLDPNGFTWIGKTCLGEKAACELTWEYLFPDKPVPLVVKLLSLYDSWTYKDHCLESMVLPFQMRMRMEQLDPRNWDKCRRLWLFLLEPSEPEWLYYPDMVHVTTLVDEGKLLLRYDEEQKRRYVQTYGFETRLGAFPYEQLVWGGDAKQTMYGKYYKAIAVNLGHTNSKVFDSVWRKPCTYCVGMGGKEDCPKCRDTYFIEPYDLMITFCRRKDKLWNVSLYSTKPDIDCGAIAKSFGGGGHKGAAGFRCKDLPFGY